MDGEIAVEIARADIAGEVPAVAQRLAGGRCIAPVFEEHVGAAHDDFTGDAVRHFAAVLVDHARLAAQAGEPGRIAARKIAADAGVDRDRARFGRAIDLQDRHAAPGQRIDQGLRDLGRAGRHRAQAREIGAAPARVLDQRLNGRGHQHDQGRAIRAQGVERGIRGKARMQRDGGAGLQRRRGLDIQPADVEQRQHGQHMIVGGEIMHVLAHHRVPKERLLPQHRAFRPAGGARGVHEEERTRGIDVRVAVVAVALRQQMLECAGDLSLVEADDADIGLRLPQRRHHGGERVLHEQRLHRCVHEDEQLLGNGEPPVERHQQRAEPRTSVEQHEIIGLIGGEDRQAVSAPDAELRFERAGRGRDALPERRVGQRAAAIAQRHLVRRERRVARDQIGQIHGRRYSSFSPGW